jgi:hypothetical protein
LGTLKVCPHILQKKKKRKGETNFSPRPYMYIVIENLYENFEIILNLVFSGQEYDRYGFVKKYDFESGEFDPLTLEAQKLERKSTEVGDKVKARERDFMF